MVETERVAEMLQEWIQEMGRALAAEQVDRAAEVAELTARLEGRPKERLGERPMVRLPLR